MICQDLLARPIPSSSLTHPPSVLLPAILSLSHSFYLPRPYILASQHSLMVHRQSFLSPYTQFSPTPSVYKALLCLSFVSFLFLLHPLLALFLYSSLTSLPWGHVTAPHDYWRNHSCNRLPSFPWGLAYLSLSLPPSAPPLSWKLYVLRQEMLVTHFDKGAGTVRALITALGGGKSRKEWGGVNGKRGRAKKKQQFDVSYYVPRLKP